MTGEPGTGHRLTTRLLLAFSAVALAGVAVVAVASLVGADRGLDAAEQDRRAAVAGAAAAEAGLAYDTAGGWPTADLAAAEATAQGAGARLMVLPPGPGAGSGSGSGSVAADVVVDGEIVGRVRLVFGSPATGGRTVAWAWIAAAAVLAMAVSVLAAWWVSRRITAPLVRLADTARAFGAGDRDARAGTDGPGEIGELARAFDDMAARVAAADAARRRMAADVAHELRTPLAVLQAELEELRDGLAEPTPQALGVLHDQALRLGRVVDDLGSLASAEAVGPSVRPTTQDLGVLATSTLAGLRGALAAAGLRVESSIAPGVMVRADADRTSQVLAVLLSNAARYCRPGDTVVVEVAPVPDWGRLVVSDTGPGIAPEDLPHVFDRFWRGPGTQDVPGSGLGLPVARALVAAQGGRIRVESDAGTRVEILLPVAH